MPGKPREQSALVRRFSGVNVTVDPGFLSADILQRAQNWVPDTTFLLTKRRGSTRVFGWTDLPMRFEALLRTYDLVGNRYLFVVGVFGAGGDIIYASLNDATPTPLTTGGVFATFDQHYGIAQLGNRVYIGNGVDPIKFIDLGVDYLTAFDIVPLTATAITGAAVAATTDTDSKLENGTYAYAWAVYNTSTKMFVSRSVASGEPSGPPAAILAGARSRLTFTSPSVGLGTDETYQLYVAPRNFPVELAFLQVPTLAASTATSLSEIADTSQLVPVKDQALRTGRFIVAHRNRLYIAGDKANPSRLYATGTIVPGLEQDLFNIGEYFPANANEPIQLDDGDEITGLAVASQRETTNDPRAPLLIFKNASTHALFGDLFDDDAELAVLSQSIGCLAHETAASTPAGVIFCALDSVYLSRADAPVPANIGTPIAAAIRALNPNNRARAFACFHQGFYKLFLLPPGGSTIHTNQWWLDLRQGLTDPPSWWGPQLGGPIQRVSVARRDGAEAEQAFVAFLGRGTGSQWNVDSWNAATWEADFSAVDTLNTGRYDTECGVSISTSILHTVIIDASQPFERKIFTRFRALGRAEVDTEATLSVFQDGNISPSFNGPLSFLGTGGANWNVAQWEIDSWASPSRFTEGDLVLGGYAARPHTQYTEFQITHTEPVRLDLRDFEARFLPVDRAVA